MKKLAFLILLVPMLFSSKVNAIDGYPDKLRIHQTITIPNAFIIILEDHSIWKLFCYNLRSQSWSEWWNSVKIDVPFEFKWQANEWRFDDSIEITNNSFDYVILSALNDGDISRLRTYYHYVLVNESANKIAFARHLSFAEFTDIFLEYAEQRYNEGYSLGYSLGYSSGYTAGQISSDTNAYNDGYNDGYEDGTHY